MKKYTFFILIVFFLMKTSISFAQNIVINEILASNNTSIQDEDGTHQDWIELYNNGSASVALLGYGLSDDPLLPLKWKFPSVTLTPGTYLIVWASSKNRAVAGSPLHTNFKISASGNSILLTNPAGTIVDQLPPVVLQPDISYGRYPNGSGPFVFFGTPTPNAANSTAGFSESLSPPDFMVNGSAQNSGFYPAGFNLSLSTTNTGSTILYTLDGSEPDEKNLSGTTYRYKNQYPQQAGQAFGPFMPDNSFKTLQYSAAIPITDRSSQPNKVSNISSTYDSNPTYLPNGPIFKGTVVKAKAIKPGALSSTTVTKNYFIAPANRFSLPVLSISTDDNQLFDYDQGIYVAGVDFDNWRKLNPSGTPSYHEENYVRPNVEKVVSLNYFVSGVETINQKVGIQIHGDSSRIFPQKSLDLFARPDYGDSKMSYKFFSDQPYTSYERLTVKNYGSSNYNTMFRDGLNAELVKDLPMETEAYQPVVTFMNGEYWGVFGIREKYDNNYFKQVYNIPTDQIDLLQDQGAIKAGDASDYNDMYAYIQGNSLAGTNNFSYIQSRMDTDNFKDYFITNIFMANTDWPGTNIVYWRKKTSYTPNAPYGNDGRWRWALHDMDATFLNYSYDALAAATDPNGPAVPNPAWSTLILRKLLENDGFKIDFINRFADLMNTNFLSSRITSKIDSMAAQIAPEMNDQYYRWKAPLNAGDWQYYLNQAKTFANQRPDNQRNHIRNKFGISNNINVTLNVSDIAAGYIKISTINIIDGTPGITGNPYPWTGIYFNNIPLKLKAIAKSGFTFDHWTGASSSTQAEITITPTADFSITAVFVPSTAEVSTPIYFWYMDSNIVNNAQLTHLNSTYQVNTAADIRYQSCIVGYPFPSTDPNYSKASMERRSMPTNLNYRPEANKNAVYSSADMKGLQIKEPLQKDGLENILVFNISTSGYKKIKFSFAALNENTNATAISIDYSINSGTPVWITNGLLVTSLPLTSSYQLLESDFSSITTVDNNSNFKIRLRFTGSNMTIDGGNRITFNNIAVDGVKVSLSYPSPNVFTVGTAITNLAPLVAQTINSYSIAPSLPAGLSLNTTTGVISGTPTIVSPLTTYMVTANYTGGSLTAQLVITVSEASPTKLSYVTPNVFVKNTAITSLNPTVEGGSVATYSITPDLPAGLSLDNKTGIISGTPTIVSPLITYTVTANYTGGNLTAKVDITVNDIPPTKLSYPTPNVFTQNAAITNLNPTLEGGSVMNYSIAPDLPSGLLFDNKTGIISGTPTLASSLTTYTVTANYSGGSLTAKVDITVNDAAPIKLSYPKSLVFTKNVAIASLNPTVEGGSVSNYSIAPNLPVGLLFDNKTGIISGTSTIVSPLTTYTITGNYAGGSLYVIIDIAVNDVAPTKLSYTTPNVFTKNVAITDLNPTISGGKVVSYSITPSLPEGLSFDTTTGRISGTPTVISPPTKYTVTAVNSGGSLSLDLIISVEDNLGLNDSVSQKIVIYPNPFSNIITVMGIDGDFSYKIFSIEGKLIRNKTNSKSTIELTELPVGMYMLQLSFNDIIVIKKIIKNK